MYLGIRGIDVASFSDFLCYYHDSDHKGCLHTITESQETFWGCFFFWFFFCVIKIIKMKYFIITRNHLLLQ